MRSYVVFSSMGPDRAGLAKEISEFFTARGLNERARKFRMLILFLFKLFLLRPLTHWTYSKTVYLQHIEYIIYY